MKKAGKLEMSKLGKKLIKSLNEAVEEAKNSKAPEYSEDGRKNWFFCGDKGWPTMTEMLADWDKEAKERWNKMTPDQRKKEKAKIKARNDKQKAEDKKIEAKYANQRAKKGYCDRDIWSVDSWLVNILPPMLKELKEIQHVYQSELGYVYDKKSDDFIKTKKNITKKQYNIMLDKLIAAIEDYRDFESGDGKYDFVLESKKHMDYIKTYKQQYKIKKKKMFKYLEILFDTLWD